MKFLKNFGKIWMLICSQYYLINELYNKKQYRYLPFNLNHYPNEFEIGKKLFLFKN